MILKLIIYIHIYIDLPNFDNVTMYCYMYLLMLHFIPALLLLLLLLLKKIAIT